VRRPDGVHGALFQPTSVLNSTDARDETMFVSTLLNASLELS